MSLFERHDWITTYCGLPFFPLAPRVEDVRLEDIAHALAHLCRFAGHTRKFYSVAQHSLIVSQRFADPKAALYGLLHDASEAYLCDITRPVKHTAALDGYRAAEARLQAVIYQRFGLGPDEPGALKTMDTVVLHTEQRDLMAMPHGWEPKTTLPTPIVPQASREAERQFLFRFYELTGERPSAGRVQ